MALVNAKCTNCNQEILIDDQKDADICPHCKNAFVTEKAIKLYNYDPEKSKKIRHIKIRNKCKLLRQGILNQKEKLLEVKCFGNFEVFAKSERLLFKRTKTKELLAYLVDRNGAGMTAKQICAVIFSDYTNESRNVAYLRQLVLDLKNTLKDVGAEKVFRHETPFYRIDTSLIKCDYLLYLENGKPEFLGEYMAQYSWADETCAMLQFKKL